MPGQLAETGVQSGQLTGHSSGLMYSVRMVAAPADNVSCRTPARTQAAALVRTVSTPLAAHASW